MNVKTQSKVVTVTLNPCFDRQMLIPSFVHGGMNRVVSTRTDAAGKGINVSAALKSLGVASLCTGFNYTENGAFTEDYLDGLGIAHDFVQVEGAVRVNIKLVEQDTSVMTEINQPGAFVPQEKIDELIRKVAALGELGEVEYECSINDKVEALKEIGTLNKVGVLNDAGDLNDVGVLNDVNKLGEKSGILILSGSRPQGVASDIYARLIENWNGRAFLDCEGEALLTAINSSRPPYLIKPNLFELETAFNVKLSDKTAIAEFCRREIISKGVGCVCVSMGGDGAMLTSGVDAWYAPALPIPVRGLAGAGESMVAGLTAGLLGGCPTGEMLRMGVAAASASVIREGTQLCTREGYDEMLGRVRVERV
jgi:1-phosphofructokinase